MGDLARYAASVAKMVTVSSSRKCYEFIDRYISPHVDVNRSIIITGFWRSGTTWLQIVLSRLTESRSVFEPLHWSVENYLDRVDGNIGFSHNGIEYIKSFMPYCLEFSSCGWLHKHLSQALHTELRGQWLRRGRLLRAALSDRSVTKMVRGQLMLPALSKMGGPTIIHIRRDPRAVIASLVRDDWGWWMRSLSLRDQLLRPNDGRREFFLRWADEISEFDSSDFVTRAAAYWALTEKFVEESGVLGANVTLLQYEKLCMEQESYLNEALEGVIGCGNVFRPVHLSGDSPTTQKGRSVSLKNRMYGWKEEMKADEIKKIEYVCERIKL